MKNNFSPLKWKISLLSLALVSTVSTANDDFLLLDLEQLVDVDVYTANVLLAHIHKENTWMFGYDYSTMHMEDIQGGSASKTIEDVHQSYMIAPVHMSMRMHGFSVMYAPTDQLTLMVMAMYNKKSMGLLSKGSAMMPAQEFTTQSSGWGDIHVNANYIFHHQETQYGQSQYGVSSGLSLPTGSISKKDFNPLMSMNMRLPYRMQLGSGTYDVNLGLLYSGIAEQWYWGGQTIATLRIGTNENNYRLGNKIDLKLWLNRAINDQFSTFIRLEGIRMENVHGSDPMLNPTMAPMADPNAQGKKKINLVVGADLFLSSSESHQQHLTVSVEKMVYQDFDGLQLKEDWRFVLNTVVVF